MITISIFFFLFCLFVFINYSFYPSTTILVLEQLFTPKINIKKIYFLKNFSFLHIYHIS